MTESVQNHVLIIESFHLNMSFNCIVTHPDVLFILLRKSLNPDPIKRNNPTCNSDT